MAICAMCETEHPKTRTEKVPAGEAYYHQEPAPAPKKPELTPAQLRAHEREKLTRTIHVIDLALAALPTSTQLISGVMWDRGYRGTDGRSPLADYLLKALDEGYKTGPDFLKAKPPIVVAMRWGVAMNAPGFSLSMNYPTHIQRFVDAFHQGAYPELKVVVVSDDAPLF